MSNLDNPEEFFRIDECDSKFEEEDDPEADGGAKRLTSYCREDGDLVEDDFDQYNAAKYLLNSSTVNVLDTAPNFRCMKAERTLGQVREGRSNVCYCSANLESTL